MYPNQICHWVDLGHTLLILQNLVQYLLRDRRQMSWLHISLRMIGRNSRNTIVAWIFFKSKGRKKSVSKASGGILTTLHLEFCLGFSLFIFSVLYCSVAGITWPMHSLYRNWFSAKSSQQTPHSSPVRASYGVVFCDLKISFMFCSVILLLYVISWYIELHYDGARLYILYIYI